MSKKEEPKPFFPIRNDFLPSLENVMNKAVMLYNAADILCSHGEPFPGRDKLKEYADAFRKAAYGED